MQGIDMAHSLEAALTDADLILLLVKHTEFVKLVPDEIALKTKTRLALDCVNGWNVESWKRTGFKLFRLGVSQ
jgi:UDPglucose 6-dehydrogenase